jgi:hypothetical protein
MKPWRGKRYTPKIIGNSTLVFKNTQQLTPLTHLRQMQISHDLAYTPNICPNKETCNLIQGIVQTQ